MEALVEAEALIEAEELIGADALIAAVWIKNTEVWKIPVKINLLAIDVLQCDLRLISIQAHSELTGNEDAKALA